MAQEKRTSDYAQKGDPGPFLAKVIGHTDSTYMGMLEVELLSLTGTGNNSQTSGQTAFVKYMSPFYGVTPFKDLSKNATYADTQKSYGMWMVPPDVGSLVMVIFVEGNYSNGYWIGCVQDQYMNFMLPGNAATTYNSTDKSKALPVGEYNKRLETGKGGDPTQYIKPGNTDAIAQLKNAGLDGDPIRGTTTSSARRELPIMVFGISTPGPSDRRPGAPKGKYGTNEATINVPFSRLGGSSFVMDDGDPNLVRKKPAGGPEAGPPEYASIEAGEKGDPTLPANELIRLRTRTGHQILMHNTEDLIYISNAKGTSWIEMTSNGKIDIYAADSVSIHTENDLNITAGRDIIMKAGNNICLTAGNDGRITAAAGTHINSKTHTETAPDGINMNGPTATPAYPPFRTPQHEPWTGHENLNPLEFVPEKTSADPEDENELDAETANNFVAEPAVIPDTFKKGK